MFTAATMIELKFGNIEHEPNRMHKYMVMYSYNGTLHSDEGK